MKDLRDLQDLTMHDVVEGDATCVGLATHIPFEAREGTISNPVFLDTLGGAYRGTSLIKNVSGQPCNTQCNSNSSNTGVPRS